MPPLEQLGPTTVSYDGRELTYFGGCDYLRLSRHPVVVQAVLDCMDKHHLNVAASRLTTGNHAIYDRLEAELASFCGVPRALLTSTGYMANLIAAQALEGEFTHALIDERAHASLLDASAGFGCPVGKFEHRSPSGLRNALSRLGERSRPVVLTDGLFGQDGAIAPLDAYLEILPNGGVLVVDDAHAVGVLGLQGRGTPGHLGVSSKKIVRTAVLSKALGCYGGVILGTSALVSKAISRSRMFAGNTPLPLPLAAAAREAVRLLSADLSFQWRLAEKTRYTKDSLRRVGFPVLDGPSPIVSLAPRDRAESTRLKTRLIEHCIYPSLVFYPGGPAGGCFRFALSTEHSIKQLDSLVNALANSI